MKKYMLLSFLFLVQFISGQDIPDPLKKYEVGIIVKHSKDTIYAQLYKGNKKNRKKYIWKYQTSVLTKNKELEIIEFGGYNKTKNDWNSKTIYNRPFNKEEFSKWYTCVNGILKKDILYTDKNNWSTSDYLDGKTITNLWYFIGIDSNKKEYIGYKEFVLVNKLKN